jgi:hypothetical protein
MKKVLISDKLADDGINFLNEQDDYRREAKVFISPWRLLIEQTF